MSEFSQRLIDRSGYLGEGFADVYDRYRPAPPESVLDVLAFVAGAERPGLVVDLGCGTGLSTRAWADRAERIVGVEANPRMVERARVATGRPNVRYLEAFAASTGLSEGEADLVTAWQAFHWMEPEPVLAEAARLLRDGGAFAACDYDVPPVVEPEVDAAFAALRDARSEARKRLGLPAGAASWPKWPPIWPTPRSMPSNMSEPISCRRSHRNRPASSAMPMSKKTWPSAALTSSSS